MIEILIVDFGSQYTQLILHKLLYNLHVNVQLIDINKFKQINYKEEYFHLKAIILSGGPNSVSNEDVDFFKNLFTDINILGICYGSQLIASCAGVKIKKNKNSQYGISKVFQYNQHLNTNKLFDKIPDEFNVWMSHSDSIMSLETEHLLDILVVDEHNNPVVWKYNNDQSASEKLIIGILFHPEVEDTQYGLQIIKNFLILSNINININSNNNNLSDSSKILLTNAKKEIKNTVGNDNVLLALSGGVDSSTLAYLLVKIIPTQIKFILIDNGLMREGEIDEIIKNYTEDIKKHLIVINAEKEFLTALEGVIDPEKKRKIIGNLFIDILSENMKDITYLAQGTIYPDLIESGTLPNSKVIKSHHNVGGLPKNMKIKLLEPFKYLFKDDIRKLALLLGMPDIIINRKPFPGPGLAIRILGEITRYKIKIIKKADFIMRSELKKKNYNIWQSAAILLPVKTVGVMGDCRTYQNVVALRMVNSINGMTASASKIPIDFLMEIATRITNEVDGVSRVVYDLSSKPPATIEWE